MRKISGYLLRPAFSLAIIAAAAFLSYSNTFNVPFYFDDGNYITYNPIVKSFDFFLDPSGVNLDRLSMNTKIHLYSRYMTHLLNAVNYSLWGLDYRWYHAVNLAVHIFSGMLVYALAVLLLETPLLRDSGLSGRRHVIGLFAALLFVTHPVQTQAVTYIAQRFASFAAMFYIASAALYVLYRNSVSEGRRYTGLLYSAMLAVTFLAMFTKEVCFTIPLAMAFIEAVFYSGSLKKRAAFLVLPGLTMAIVPLTFLARNYGVAETFQSLTGRYMETDSYKESLIYLYTSFRVMATYLRLLVLPVNQHFDYDQPRLESLFVPAAWTSLLLHLFILGLSAFLVYKGKTQKRGALALLGFGGVWFYLSLSVESGIVPLDDVIFEHRVYLPSAGVFISASAASVMLWRRLRSESLRRGLVIALAGIPLILGAAAYVRNTIWNDPVEFWKDNIRKSPGKTRAYFSLGREYSIRGNFNMAEEVYLKGLEGPDKSREGDLAFGHTMLGLVYRWTGRLKDSERNFKTALNLAPYKSDTYINLGELYRTKGIRNEARWLFEKAMELPDADISAYWYASNMLIEDGDYIKAEKYLLEAIRLDPGLGETWNNLGLLYLKENRIDEAQEALSRSVMIFPDNFEARLNLGTMLLNKGMAAEAAPHLDAAVGLKEDDYRIRNKMGLLLHVLGRKEEAIASFEEAVRLKPDDVESRFNLAVACRKSGRNEEARREFRAVLTLEPAHQKARENLNALENL